MLDCCCSNRVSTIVEIYIEINKKIEMFTYTTEEINRNEIRSRYGAKSAEFKSLKYAHCTHIDKIHEIILFLN